MIAEDDDMDITKIEVVATSTITIPVVETIAMVLDDDNERGIVYRRDGTCPLGYSLIREVLEFIHDHIRFTLTRHGLSDANEPIPTKLSMLAIINARLMDYYRDVLLGASLREKTWPIVESNAMYDNVVPWLQANRCPRMYTAITVLAANDYGIYKGYPYYYGFVYEGEWVDGKRTGQGTCTYADGNVFKGSWLDDKRSGLGKLTYANGNFYEGGWLDDQMHGQGIKSDADGIFYEGDMMEGDLSGNGKYIYICGSIYEGSWIKGKNHGQGTCTYPDGTIYEGDWKDGNRNGQDTFTYPDGTIYEGSWVDHNKHGQGTLTTINGLVLSGQFEDNFYVELLLGTEAIPMP